MDRYAKIVITAGPASQDSETIERLIIAGVNVVRLNFSHGTHADHAEVINRVRNASKRLNKPVTILQDLQGPKIRVGEIPGGSLELIPDHLLTISTRKENWEEFRSTPVQSSHAVDSFSHVIVVDFPELPRSVEPGGRILLDDGNMELVVIAVEDDRIETRVAQGGVLKSNKGVNLPGAKLTISGFTEKDREDLAFGLANKVDAVAVSFVRVPKDIVRVRQAIARLAPERNSTPIIAKLERPEALENLEEIVHVSDGVMVARGDLGVEMPPEVVPIVQKKIIECANRHSKVVITATQMLDSMIHNPRPTRAEATDVANAIFDGTDAVMLSGETAIGEYPLRAVQIMDAIIRQAEANMQKWGHWKGARDAEGTQDDAFYMTQAARELAHDRNVAAIAVFTKSGRTALLMSKSRPRVQILAFTPMIDTYGRLGLYWGVLPHLVPRADTIDEMLAAVESAMRATTPIQPGQQVVLIFGFPVDEVRPSNMALLHTVGKG